MRAPLSAGDADKAIVTPALVLPSVRKTGHPLSVSHEGRLSLSYYGFQCGGPAIDVAVVEWKL